MFLKFDGNVCRVCLDHLGSVNLVNQDSNVEKFSFVTFLEVSKDDGLPHSLCVKCSACLKVAYNFKIQAVAADNQMKSYLKTVNNSFSTYQQSSETFDELDKDLSELNSWLPENERISLADCKQSDIFLQNAIEITEAKNGNNVKNGIEFEVVVKNDRKNYINSVPISENDINYEMMTENLDDHTMAELDQITGDQIGNNKITNKIKKVIGITRSKSRTFNKIVNDLFQCLECENTFTKEINLKRHMDIHKSNREGHKCNICGKLFTQLSSVRQHLLIHTGERPYPCSECNKSFRRKKTLMTHILSHTKEKPFQCKYCDLKFASKQALNHHSFRLHEDDKQETVSYNCNECHKVYYTKYSLNEHFTNVHDTQVSKCSFCSKIFYTKRSYKEHIKIHNDVNECNMCNQTFRSSKELKQHMEIHESNEEHKCTHCDQVFGRKFKLILHMQKHTEAAEANTQKGYECGQCRIFQANDIDTMYDHLREKHSQDQLNSFKCFHCDEIYDTKNELSNHFETHKELYDEIILCDACNLTFLSFENYSEHMIEYHTLINLRYCNACNENLEKLNASEFNKHQMDHNIILLR